MKDHKSLRPYKLSDLRKKEKAKRRAKKKRKESKRQERKEKRRLEMEDRTKRIARAIEQGYSHESAKSAVWIEDCNIHAVICDGVWDLYYEMRTAFGENSDCDSYEDAVAYLYNLTYMIGEGPRTNPERQVYLSTLLKFMVKKPQYVTVVSRDDTRTMNWAYLFEYAGHDGLTCDLAMHQYEPLVPAPEPVQLLNFPHKR